ncbi:TPA: ead/Ea22-like family protein [Escherichia coli]
MSKIDYQALREKAEKATCGVWSLEYGEGRFDGDDALIHREVAGYIPICRIEGAHPESGFDEDFQMEQQANAEFIAAASPATVLALLDERESQNKRIAELEKSEEQLINERDHAESALDDMYFAATGNRPEWSNWFGFSDAVDAVVDRIADLEAKQPSPVVPEEKPMPNPLSMYAVDAVAAIAEVRGWNACRAVSYSHADNQPASGNQAAESNRGNEWTGNPDIDNAIIMLDRIDTLENCDDDRIEAVKAVLRRLAGNYPVTPDGWISCSERMPDKLIPVMVMYEDGEMWSAMWNGNRWDDGTEYPDPHSVTHWREMPAAPQQEVK